VLRHGYAGLTVFRNRRGSSLQSPFCL